MVGHQKTERQKERKELNLEKAGEIMTGIVIDVTIGTVTMTVIATEVMTAPVAMIQGEGSVLVPGSAGIDECFFCVKKFPLFLVELFYGSFGMARLMHACLLIFFFYCR
jgi:hypothetical protein